MDLFDLVATLTLDTSGYEKGLNDSEKKGGKFGSGLAKAAKITTAAVGAASAAVGALTKKSVEAYAEYEQLSGGIKKLYEDGAEDMLNYANQAYKTSGMSANAYMQNVTGFSAALINSVDGDSKEAARIADMAMQDISDNANTFGKYTAEELAGVYQALAKGQFQTLDNLNLGYGGSKEGMQSLIDKANELAKAQGMAGDLTIDSYADIVQAIHLVQDNMNITGTTMNEAATTIEGSLNMTKAAWENLVAGFANPDADMGQLMDNLVVAIVGDGEGRGLLNQLIPAVKTAVEGIGQFLQAAVPMLAQQLPAMIQNFLPIAIDAIITLVTSIADALPDIISTLVEMMPDIIDKVVNGLVDAIIKVVPILVKEAPRIVKALAKGIISSIGTLMSAGNRMLSSLDNAIKKGLANIGKKALALAKQIPHKIKSGLGSLASVGMNLIEGLWNGIKAKFDAVVGRVKALAAKLPAAVRKVLGISSPSKVFAEVGKWIPAGLAKGIESNSGIVSTAINDMVDASVDVSGSGFGAGGGVQITNYFTVNGADDPEYFADAVSDRLTRQLKLGMRTI